MVQLGASNSFHEFISGKWWRTSFPTGAVGKTWKNGVVTTWAAMDKHSPMSKSGTCLIGPVPLSAQLHYAYFKNIQMHSRRGLALTNEVWSAQIVGINVRMTTNQRLCQVLRLSQLWTCQSDVSTYLVLHILLDALSFSQGCLHRCQFAPLKQAASHFQQ